MFKWFKKFLERNFNPSKNNEVHVEQTLHASIIKACSVCGSAGVDSFGNPVGLICPVCGSQRPPNENKGLIWRKLKNVTN